MPSTRTSLRLQKDRYLALHNTANHPIPISRIIPLSTSSHPCDDPPRIALKQAAMHRERDGPRLVKRNEKKTVAYIFKAAKVNDSMSLRSFNPYGENNSVVRGFPHHSLLQSCLTAFLLGSTLTIDGTQRHCMWGLRDELCKSRLRPFRSERNCRPAHGDEHAQSDLEV